MQQEKPLEVYATLGGPVNAEMAQRVFTACANGMQNGVKKIHILIHSSGGFVSDGIGIYNYLDNLPLEVITYNAGQVSSIAVLIFLAGKQRFASDTALFMIHKTHYAPAAGIKEVGLRDLAKSAALEDARVERILKSRINIPKKMWVAHRNSDLYLTAKEALSFGLINSIHNFAPPLGSQLYNI